MTLNTRVHFSGLDVLNVFIVKVLPVSVLRIKSGGSFDHSTNTVSSALPPLPILRPVAKPLFLFNDNRTYRIAGVLLESSNGGFIHVDFDGGVCMRSMFAAGALDHLLGCSNTKHGQFRIDKDRLRGHQLEGPEIMSDF